MKVKILLIVLLFSAAILGGIFLMNDPQTTSEQRIEEHYMDESNCIRAYPDDSKSSCLSESVGLYMDFLLEADDKKDFAKQVSVLKDQFIEKEEQDTFIRWKLDDDTTVNAIIDDVRIIQALKKGSEQFNQKSYSTLADQLTTSLDASQEQGIYVDFYDWKNHESAPQITLSYITKKFASAMPDSEQTIKVLENSDISETFFPENYVVDKQKYTNQEEVHMVDQILIAINRHDFGFDSDHFDNWLRNRWEEGILYGRYDRKTLEPTVEYESLAVYYYLNRYFRAIDEQDLAVQVANRADDLIEPDNLAGVHFFDYIQNKKMKQAMKSDS